MQLTDVPRKVFSDGKTEFRPGFLDIFHIMDTTPQSDTLDARDDNWTSLKEIRMKMLSPVVGWWYKDLQTGALFEVVAWDPGSLTIETQYLDGEVTEYDLDAWRELYLERAEAPEDWRAAFELDGEMLLDPDLPMHPDDWSNPLNTIEPDTMYGVEDY